MRVFTGFLIQKSSRRRLPIANLLCCRNSAWLLNPVRTFFSPFYNFTTFTSLLQVDNSFQHLSIPSYQQYSRSSDLSLQSKSTTLSITKNPSGRTIPPRRDVPSLLGPLVLSHQHHDPRSCLRFPHTSESQLVNFLPFFFSCSTQHPPSFPSNSSLFELSPPS